MGGILGATLGESPAEAQARIEEAKKTAKDLTGLVRRKAKAPEAAEESANGTSGTAANGKRKAEDLEEDDVESSKKARVEDAVEA
jgi:HAT1-interacting factor 1